jgi:hypothetical protein
MGAVANLVNSSTKVMLPVARTCRIDAYTGDCQDASVPDPKSGCAHKHANYEKKRAENLAQRFESRLWYCPQGEDARRLCETAPQTIRGTFYDKPTFCDDRVYVSTRTEWPALNILLGKQGDGGKLGSLLGFLLISFSDRPSPEVRQGRRFPILFLVLRVFHSCFHCFQVICSTVFLPALEMI